MDRQEKRLHEAALMKVQDQKTENPLIVMI